jgi:hypothetical protein
MKQGTSYQGKEQCQMGSAVFQQCRMKEKSAKAMVWSGDGDRGASKLAQEG